MPKVINLRTHKDYKEFVEKTPWVCEACDNDTFWLTTDGCVYCTNCKEGVEDLKTVEVSDD